jgi:uncharacterized iron-regulated protein
VAALALGVAGAAAISPPDEILRLRDNRPLDLPSLVADLKGRRMVFMGEIHDQEGHHRAQARLIDALHQQDIPLAVGLEMFQAASQADLDLWVAGQIAEQDFVPLYRRNWGVPWPLYRPIFLYARDHRIPLLGLNVPPEITRKVARRGFSSLDPEDLARLPGVSCDVDKVYEAFISRVLGDRAHSRREFRFFCEAQMVWDTTMAHALRDFAERRPGTMVVVLAGSGHAWKRGIPARLGDPQIPFAVILPEVPVGGRTAVTPADADYLWRGITDLGSR